LDPLFWCHVKLAVAEVVGDNPALVPAEGTNGAVHFYRNRPTRKCEMMGHVVTLNVRDNKTFFTLDDGTGCIECVVWMNSAGDDGGGTMTAGGGAIAVGDFSIDRTGLRLGALVRVQGRVSEYRDRKQLVVNAVRRCVDANAESLFWLDHARSAREATEGGGGGGGEVGD